MTRKHDDHGFSSMAEFVRAAVAASYGRAVDPRLTNYPVCDDGGIPMPGLSDEELAKLEAIADGILSPAGEVKQ